MATLHAFANPARFLKIAKPLTPALFWAGVALIVLGCWAGLTQTPPDYLQGETVRILYIHVPAAWLGMGGWRQTRNMMLEIAIPLHPP
ncbi:MAG: heme ABC transporter permease, partial [Sphingomonas sp.]